MGEAAATLDLGHDLAIDQVLADLDGGFDCLDVDALVADVLRDFDGIRGGIEMGTKMTVAEYATHRGVSRTAVYKAIKTGRIQVDAEGNIDQDLADLSWSRNTRPKVDEIARQESAGQAPPGTIPGPGLLPPREPAASSGGRDPDGLGGGVGTRGTTDDYMKVKTAREVLQLRRARIELDEKTGKLVPKDSAILAFTASITSARTNLEGLPARVASKVVGMTDVGAIRDLIAEEIEASLRGVSDVPEFG